MKDELLPNTPATSERPKSKIWFSNIWTWVPSLEGGLPDLDYNMFVVTGGFGDTCVQIKTVGFISRENPKLEILIRRWEKKTMIFENLYSKYKYVINFRMLEIS